MFYGVRVEFRYRREQMFGSVGGVLDPILAVQAFKSLNPIRINDSVVIHSDAVMRGFPRRSVRSSGEFI